MASQSWYDISVNKSIGNNDIIIKKMLDKNLDKNILNDEWVLWCHDIKDSNWGKDSYIKVYSFNTIEDFWKLYKNLNNVDNIMLFLMKKGIFPLWEDQNNRDGGAWSFKIKKKDNFKIWLNMSMALVGCWITENDDIYNNITGISINPHLYTSVVKVWCNNNNYKDNLDIFKNIMDDLEPIYKIHKIQY